MKKANYKAQAQARRNRQEARRRWKGTPEAGESAGRTGDPGPSGRKRIETALWILAGLFMAGVGFHSVRLSYTPAGSIFAIGFVMAVLFGAFGVGIIFVWSAFVTRRFEKASVLLRAIVVLVAGLAASMVASRLEERNVARSQSDAAAILEALKSYNKTSGGYPEGLEALVSGKTKSLDRLPEAATGGSVGFRYRRLEEKRFALSFPAPYAMERVYDSDAGQWESVKSSARRAQ